MENSKINIPNGETYDVKFENKQKEKNIENLNRNMKSVDTYGNGTTGYRIKNGVNAGKVVGHIQRTKSEI